MEIRRFPTVLLSVFIICIILSCNDFSFSHCANFPSETDKLALLAIKDQITHDPFGVLGTWNDSLQFCRWRGVKCGRRHRRVVALDLRLQKLSGSISPHVGNLTFLRSINLQNNSFHGEIPLEMGRLSRLQSIIFSVNSLEGEIPINLTRCSELRFLDLVANKLVGRIPEELGTLSKLRGLGLAVNNLTGSIPKSLSNLSSLTQLSLSENCLSGEIPVELGRLRQLVFFQVSSNRLLSGSVPSQLFNISSIDFFAVAENQLYGELPPDMGFTLPNLRMLLFGGNRFTGPIPPSITNASKLERLDIGRNNFSGSVPTNLGSLKNLARLNLGLNKLGSGKGDDLNFLSSLVNCTELNVLALSNNSLTGILPDSIANLSSQLNFLLMGANRISGSIPTAIGNLRNLLLMSMEENLLTGQIPDSIGQLSNLQVLSLFGSRFSGEIPSSLGNLTSLTELNLEDNALQGSIPSSLGNLGYLQSMDLSGNNLSGSIAKEVIGLSSLTDFLDLSENYLIGSIPMEIGKLKNILVIDLSDNKLSGEIPSSLGECILLESLYLEGNSLQGPIPPSLSSLRGIQAIDLSRNNLYGEIPTFLGKFPFLSNINLSFNNLEGEVPKEGIFGNASAISITKNAKLCGGIPELLLQICPSRGSQKRRDLSPKVIIIIACLCTGLVSIFSLAIIYWRGKSRRKPSVSSPLNDRYSKVSYAELLKATDGFSSANLIGAGSYGFVYKGILGPEETVVAVKVLDLQRKEASKSFTSECEALRSIRHRNLLKIFTSCSSVDFNGNEFKALVFEYMSNGSLEKWLYPKANEQNQQQNLSFFGRLNIAIDVARALDYLHHHCHTPIVHCDLKPGNVLLDSEMNAHVGDFGLARVLYDKSSTNPTTTSSRIKGSIGYVAPEYGVTGTVSTSGDVFSYGILLLEMFTGKKPTDEMFGEGLSLHNLAEMAIPDRVAEIAEPAILEEALYATDCNSQEFDTNSKAQIQKSLVSIMRIGVKCSAELPRERMVMTDVVAKLQAIRNQVL